MFQGMDYAHTIVSVREWLNDMSAVVLWLGAVALCLRVADILFSVTGAGAPKGSDGPPHVGKEV